MENIIVTLNEIKKINSRYELSNEAIDKSLKAIESAKVCTPIIGKFSSGKSAILNTLLGYSRRLLKEDITPQTAVPTELYFSELKDFVTIVSNEGAEQEVALSDYRAMKLDANTTQCVRLGLKNSFLEEIQDIMLVDMPGFESGFEIHNKAIDSYLPKSLAYLVTFPAEDMVLRSSIGNILKELCLHDMPICVVITKCDKVNDDIIDANLKKLKGDLARYIGDRELSYCFTSSLHGDAKELEAFLLEIEEKSQPILENKFKSYVINAASTTENYLKAALNNNTLSESELDEKEDKLKDEMNALNERIKEEEDGFGGQIDTFVEEIKSDVQSALQAEESTLVAMMVNNQDIREKVNAIVRNSVTISIQKRFVPKIQKYLEKISSCIDIDVFAGSGFGTSKLRINTEDTTKKIAAATVFAVGAGVLALPILVNLVAVLISAIRDLIQGSKRREEAKAQARQKLITEVIPSIVRQVGISVELELTKQISALNVKINEEISSQRTVLEKAIADLRQQQADEKEKKDNLVANLKQDLEQLGGIINAL